MTDTEPANTTAAPQAAQRRHRISVTLRPPVPMSSAPAAAPATAAPPPNIPEAQANPPATPPQQLVVADAPLELEPPALLHAMPEAPGAEDIPPNSPPAASAEPAPTMVSSPPPDDAPAPQLQPAPAIAFADGHTRVGPGPIAALRLHWTVRIDATGAHFIDETIGGRSRPIRRGPLTAGEAAAMLDDLYAAAEERLARLRRKMIGDTDDAQGRATPAPRITEPPGGQPYVTPVPASADPEDVLNAISQILAER